MLLLLLLVPDGHHCLGLIATMNDKLWRGLFPAEQEENCEISHMVTALHPTMPAVESGQTTNRPATGFTKSSTTVTA